MSSAASEADAAPAPQARRRRDLITLSVAALGVVYGDIGTSPLYALRECFHGPHAVPVNTVNVLGVLSLMFWALVTIIAIKYLAYVMRADNRGEGGILALMALALASSAERRRRTSNVLILLGLFGACLLYGDGVLTPAISVLSAVEGLKVAAPSLEHYVLPVTVLILVALFSVQRRGTHMVGAIFGPVTLLWFVVLAVLGARQVIQAPGVLVAVSPLHAITFFQHNGATGFIVLGAVFLVVTGGEALYADMGHFGAGPIRITWFGLVMPALLLNYFGQGALLLQDPTSASNPFYLLAPEWALYPLLLLATCATVVASQALISGAFSLTRQAVMLGYWPRVEVHHTSAKEIGQIYVPTVNWGLMVATVLIVLEFKSSSNLAAAYGIAVVVTMTITTVLAFFVARSRWGWPLPVALLVTGLLLVPDGAFLAANLAKIGQGGWVPLGVGAVLLLTMTTWSRGRELLGRLVREQLIPLEDFFELLHIERPARVPGTAVYMTSNPSGTPAPLMQNFVHNRAVHEHVVLLTLRIEEVARVRDERRVRVEELGHGFVRVVARYGFFEQPNVVELLSRADTPNHPLEHTTFFLGRETLLASGRHGMVRWRERLFAFLSRNAQRPMDFFNLPSHRVLEIGAQVEL